MIRLRMFAMAAVMVFTTATNAFAAPTCEGNSCPINGGNQACNTGAACASGGCSQVSSGQRFRFFRPFARFRAARGYRSCR